MDGQQRPLFFIHVMKTAGTTFFYHLRAHFGAGWVFPGALQAERPLMTGGDLIYFDLATLKSLLPVQVMGYKALAGHYPYVASQHLGRDVDTVTILRDPVDRAVSFLRHAKQHMPEFREATAEKIYAATETNQRFIRNHQTKVFSMNADDELRSVLDIVDMDDRRLETAKANLDAVTLVGLQEHFDEFLDEARQQFRIERQPDLDDQRVADVSIEVGESLRERIAEDNAIDVDFYRHARAMCASRRREKGTTTPPVAHAAGQRVRPDGGDLPSDRDRVFFIRPRYSDGGRANRLIRRNIAPEEIYPYPGSDSGSGEFEPATDVEHLLAVPHSMLDSVTAIRGTFPFVVVGLLPGRWVTIAILRDPVARVIDELRRRYAAEYVRALGLTLEEIYEIPAFHDANLCNHQARLFAADRADSLKTYQEWIATDEPRMARAKASLEAVDVLGLVEDYPSFERRVTRRLRWEPNPKPPSAKVIDAPEPSAALRQRIRDDLPADLELYEHAQALLATDRRL